MHSSALGFFRITEHTHILAYERKLKIEESSDAGQCDKKRVSFAIGLLSNGLHSSKYSRFIS